MCAWRADQARTSTYPPTKVKHAKENHLLSGTFWHVLLNSFATSSNTPHLQHTLDVCLDLHGCHIGGHKAAEDADHDARSGNGHREQHGILSDGRSFLAMVAGSEQVRCNYSILIIITHPQSSIITPLPHCYPLLKAFAVPSNRRKSIASHVSQPAADKVCLDPSTAAAAMTKAAQVLSAKDPKRSAPIPAMSPEFASAQRPTKTPNKT